MNKTNDFKYNLPAYSDPVDIEDLNDNFRGIDDALMAGLCKKDYTGNNMGSSDPSARKYAWAPWLEIVNDNEFDVVVTDRNAPVESEEATINIAAGQTFRKYINGRYYMNFYVQDQHDVTFKWFTNAETYINESGGGGGGTGTVTSVSVQGGSGSHLTGSGNPIETSGTITINVDEGYSIPSDNEQTAWDGKAADLKAEIDSSTYVLTLQLKDSAGNLIGTAKTIDLPLETMVVDGEYDSQTKKIKLELKNGNYVEFSVADLVSGLQTELSASNKLDPDYIDYDSNHRAVSDTEKNTWNSKQNAISDLATIRSGAAAGATAVQPSAMQTALAGKQDSLDQTQLAAVNSGIDSTKVAQISTNQSNILFTLNRTGKNLARELPTHTVNGVTLTNNGDGTYTITRTASSYDAASFIFGDNSNGKLTGCILTGGAVGYGLKGRIGDTSSSVVSSTDWTTPKTIPSEATGVISVGVDADENPQNVQIRPFICEADVYAIDPSFVKPALPNYDLTRLEAEDRASLAEVVDSGAKNLLTNKGQLSHGDVTFTWNNDGSVTVSGTKTAGAECYVNIIDNVPYSNMGLKAGDTIVLSNNGTNAYISVIFWASGSGYTSATVAVNEAKPVVLPTNKTHILIRLTVKSDVTSISETIKPMICTKAAFGVSPAFVPYRLPLSDNTWVKSADLFPSHRTEFDVNNSHVYTYTNKFLNKVVVSIELKAASAISSATGVLSIASNIANIPPKPVFYDINDITNNFECVILKNNANGSLAFKVTTGTISSGTAFSMQIEYTYGLN